MRRRREELGIPPEVEDDPNAVEILRAWVANQSLICALLPDAFSAHSATESTGQSAVAWGIVLADIARHVSGAMHDLHGKAHSETIAEILRVFNGELIEKKFDEMANATGRVIDDESTGNA